MSFYLPSSPSSDSQSDDLIDMVCPFKIPTCAGCRTRPPGEGTSESGENPDDTCLVLNLDPQATFVEHASTLDDGNSYMAFSFSRSPTPLRLNSVANNRAQLLEEFVHMYFPVNASDTDAIWCKLLCRECLQPASVTMTAAVDTLCLLQLGTAHRDAALLDEAEIRYCATVANLRIDLENPTAMYDDGVLGAIYVLGFCELYESMSTREHGYGTHHQGLISMLLARGPKSKYSPFAQVLLYNIRHIATVFGHAKKQRAAFTEPGWKQCLALTSKRASVMSDLVTSITLLLECTDRCLRDPQTPSHEFLALLAKLSTLELELHAWLLQWYRSFDDQPYRVVKTAAFRHFPSLCGDAIGQFPRSCLYPSFATASTHVTYWCTLVHVKEMLLDLSLARPEFGAHERRASLVADLDELVDNTCRSVAYLSQPKHGSCGVMRAQSALHYAYAWYKKRANASKLAWCVRMRKGLEKSGIVSPFPHIFGYAEEGDEETEEGEEECKVEECGDET